MKGVTRARSSGLALGIALLLDRDAERFLNPSRLPGSPASEMVKAQSSPRWFSIGVPDRQSRCLP